MILSTDVYNLSKKSCSLFLLLDFWPTSVHFSTFFFPSSVHTWLMTFKDVYWLRPIAIFLKTSFECKNKTMSASLHAIFHKMQTSPRRVEGKKSCIMMHEQILVKAKKKWGFEFFTIWFKLWTYIVASSHHLICIKNRQIWTGHKEIERLFSNPHALCEHLARRRGNTIILFTFTVIISWQIWSHS